MLEEYDIKCISFKCFTHTVKIDLDCFRLVVYRDKGPMPNIRRYYKEEAKHCKALQN